MTPLLLLWVFIGSLLTPKGGDWAAAFSGNWELDNSSIISKLMNSGLKEQLAVATDPVQVQLLENQIFFANATRLLLVAVFVTLAGLVYLAYQRNTKKELEKV